MKFNNYVLNKSDVFELNEKENASIGGVAIKSGILVLSSFIAACLTIILLNSLSAITYGIYFVGIITTFVLQIVISFNPSKAKALSIPYAIGEGIVIGILCDILNTILPGEGLALAGFALMITLGILGICILLYTNGRFRATPAFIKFFTVSLAGIVLASLLFSIISIFTHLISGVSLWGIYFASPLSLIVSIVMVIISSIYVLLTIQSASELVERGFSKDFEWYCAFGIAVAVIMLFLDVFRLLIRILASNKND